MLLDQVTFSSAPVADQLTRLGPAAKDELAYVVLVGLLGKVPDRLDAEEFRVGELSLRYEWLTEASAEGTVVARIENLKLVLSDGVPLLDGLCMPMSAVLELWVFIQEHSDSIAFRPPPERQSWISSTAQAFGASDEFVKNLATNYPQLRRLCS